MNELSILKGAFRPEFLKEETLVDLFQASVQNHPQKTALVFANKQLTYFELDQWSNKIAQQLIAAGVFNGQCVGVWLPRGVEITVAILGILKAGGTYVPFDKELPLDRVQNVLHECQARFCFSQTPFSQDAGVVALQVAGQAQTSPPINNSHPHEIAYIIYTSGTTGKPKGIPIKHQQIAHFVRSENSVLQVCKDDRVYQGFSVSFDMWCEETWISLFAGATLYLADEITAKAIDELPAFLSVNAITVLHAVPSLLAVIDDTIVTLRTINAGGEACTKAVLKQWAKPGRKFFNSYGPTETTVSASIACLGPNDEITIGQPLPNYNLAIVDETLTIVPRGTPGELVVTGPGLSEGYIQLPELTAEKFAVKPAHLTELPGDRLYRTGDAAIIHTDGRVEFQGRLDDQVKLRGYRIELGEIESRLAGLTGVRNAAVALKKDQNGMDELVAYCVVAATTKQPQEQQPQEQQPQEQQLLEQQLKDQLSALLPIYMVPGAFVFLTELPRLASGKVNRKALPLPISFTQGSEQQKNASAFNATAPVAEKILVALKRIFPNRTIDLEMDFFHDLSGHSLLAATFVSHLRKDAGVSHASLRDIYQHRPLKELAKHWEQTAQAPKYVKAPFQKVPLYRYITCWIAQSLALPLMFGIFACQIFFPYLGYYYMQQETNSHFYALITAFLLFCFIPPFLILTGVISKWLVIGKFKEGDYPLWGQYYFRYWFVKTIQELVPLQFLNNTPLYPIYLKLLGAKVAKDAQLGAIKIWAEDLVTIGKDVSISSDVNLNNVVIEGGVMKIRRITIGDHAYIGTGSVVGGGAIMEPWAELQDLSYLPEGKTMLKAEVWGGSPARKIALKSEAELPQPLAVSERKHFRYTILYFILLLVFPLALLTPFFPVLYSINELDNNASDYNFNYMIYFPLLTLAYQFLFMVFSVMMSRLLVPDLKPGSFPVHSSVYVRKWLTDQIMSLSLIVLHPIYATLYIAPFFRALGAKIGKGTEISTASNVTHSLLEIGDAGFVADAVKLGEADVRAQQMHLDKTIIGNNSFVGNSAVVPQGYRLTDNTLVGVLSVPPTTTQINQTKPSDWFGSPSIALPRRQESQLFPDSLLNKPSRLRYLCRALAELIRIIIPETVILCLSVLLIAYGHDLLIGSNPRQFIFWFPIYYLRYIGIPAFIITVLLKWILVGGYRPKQMPIWTFGVWKSEAITVIYEALAVPFFLNFFKGTPWLPFFMRMLGVKTGSRVYMNTTDLTEFDRVTIGDDAALNYDCGPQTHLFEDRIMKIGSVKIGDRTSIGAMSIILYDTEIGADIEIKPLTLVMKGERLNDATSWTGSPASPL